jgi:hypothetical protein
MMHQMMHQMMHRLNLLLIEFTTHIYNYTRENEAFRELINPDAKPFQEKYKKVSPAMKEGLTNRIYSLQEMLLMKPLMFTIT